ncbi:uncharacterized protein LOC124912047 [Impatiens glandulifera]|uniref:uncharacterized protein LOC124912047 n=1 Tax=Impatiens glandulifera TaxID=253017 RepID=UPI001FB05165|nr:uncharacterized protein LOC124912047 [Impatiens glandulifera]
MEEGNEHTRKSKRKKSINLRKLLIGEEVEVRNVEDGFLGSWNSGRVISYEFQARRIEYDHIMCDDDSTKKLIERVKVTPAIEGSCFALRSSNNYRGLIRPLPPHFDFDLWKLQYGQCVDVYYMDAYWEGVIFDHNDGLEERLIIFPDIGDEMLMRISNIRISQDWDETSGDWKPREKWLFLELVKEFSKEWPLHVSLKEIWYGVRAKKRFMNLKEWTSTMRDTWKEVMLEVIHDYQSLALKHVLQILDNDLPLEIQSKSKALALVSCDGSNHSIERKDNIWSIAGADIVPFHRYDLDAVYKYCQLSSKGRGNHSGDLKVRVRQHLASLGWKIEFLRDGGKSVNKMRYTSPEGEVFMSLVLVCKTLLRPVSKKGVINEEVIYEPEYNHEALLEYVSIGAQHKKGDHSWYRKSNVKDIQLKVRKHLSFLGWKFSYFIKGGKRELRYCSPKGRIYISLIAICKECMNEGRSFSKVSPSNMLCINEETTQSSQSIKSLEENDSRHLISKRVRHENPTTSSCSNPQTILSWLIDNNVVLPMTKVYYISRKDQSQLAEGRITREGINCVCCAQVFTLTKFEAHAGSTSHRPAANIFLDDGRSILKCQSQLRKRNKIKSLMTKSEETRDDISSDNINDYICSKCHIGGELILCDKCPSSYHISCLGLKDVPDGDWFCPSCCCGFCGKIKFLEDANEVKNDSFLSCDQCQHKCMISNLNKRLFILYLSMYHMECLKEMVGVNPGNVPMKSCFCSKRCEEIFSELESRLGKCIPVGENLTWTLWKGVCSNDGPDDKEVESYSKLNVALNVMHECFEPVKDSGTRRDIVEDVIFCRRSELNRLNFEGFFTVILEKDDELVSVANIRIHGEKVAEMPLVATRFQYRRSGMCRILINELEKMLIKLGIQRIVLPAVSSVVNTWKNAFGFSEMTKWEKLMFLNHTFLDFQGTIMCQKMLRNESLLQIQLFPTSENEIEAYKVISESNENELINVSKMDGSKGVSHQDVFSKDVSVVANAELGVHKYQFDGFVKFYKRRCKFGDPKATRVFQKQVDPQTIPSLAQGHWNRPSTVLPCRSPIIVSVERKRRSSA